MVKKDDNLSASPDVRRLQTEVRQTRLLLNGAKGKIADLGKGLKTLNGIVKVLQQGQTTLPPAPVSDILWNGELGHSVNSWFDLSYTTTDNSKECAFFFSHFRPFVPIVFTDSNVDLTANTITFVAGNDIVSGHCVRLTTDGTLPTPLAIATNYFAIRIDDLTIKLATTFVNAFTGTAIDLTVKNVGNHRIQPHLDSTDARTSSTNQELKRSEGTHSTYSPRFSDWDGIAGVGRLSGTTTIDSPVPSNVLEPEMTAYIGIRAARRNAYIDIPDTLLMFGGIADNTEGQGDFLKGTLGFNAVASRDGSGTNLTREYRMFVETDRGYTILSPAVTVANGVPDGGYNETNFVELSWHPVAGYLNIQLWMFTASTGVYRLLQETSSGTSTYIDNGVFVRTDTGYPTATTTERKAVFYTREGELTELALDGYPWDTIVFPTPIPDNYDRSLTTDRQWVRIGTTQACDLLIPGCTTSGAVVTTPSAVPLFEAAYDSIYDAGELTAKLYDAGGTLVATIAIVNRLTTSTITLASAPSAGTYTVRIVGGGFHGILIDKIYLGLQANTTFTPNPFDIRTLQPVALPTGQGGVGPGGDGGGVACVASDEPIALADMFVPASHVTKGNYVRGENMAPNVVADNTAGLRRTRLVRLRNGIQKRCTETHRFKMNEFDGVGTALSNLRVNDRVMSNLDGRDELSPIASISELSDIVTIQKIILSGGHYYRAGRWTPNWWQNILINLRLMKPKVGTIYAHNRKRFEG